MAKAYGELRAAVVYLERIGRGGDAERITADAVDLISRLTRGARQAPDEIEWP
jgi:hypothetical protein